jgi:hypothetical protein
MAGPTDRYENEGFNRRRENKEKGMLTKDLVDVINMKGEKEMEEKKNLNTGETANKGLAMDDSKTATRLFQKQFSPLVVRRHYVGQGPLFVGIICDADLSDLDTVILDIVDESEKLGLLTNNIQAARNFAGYMNDRIEKHYNGIKRGVVEGVAVLFYADNCMISSTNKNFMCHEKCCNEFYMLCNIMTKI